MAETNFKYDVFVSYSSANKDWVRKTFVPILEKAGLKVCDYYRDFDVGAPIVMEMERAILESRKTIPVFSPAYLKSGWTEFESLMFQTLDAANRDRHVLPVIFESCELPLRIKYMNCINFANPDAIEIEWQRLSRALGVTLSPSILDSKRPSIGSRDTWHLAHPYPMPPNFTGRAVEQKMLDDWLADDKDRLFILRALGGFGKSALGWQWINTHVNPAEWTKLVWWSFYEGDASFEHFIEETLKYLNLEISQGLRLQVDELLKAMQSEKILFIMDGFERILRAYSSMNAAYQGDELKVEDKQLDCVNINAEIFLKSVCSLPDIKGKVLITTRLTPHAVKPRGEFMQGCREVELTSMQSGDAVEFFRKQNINGIRAEIESVCEAYGYHPLSLRILTGLIINDRESPRDVTVANKFDITDDIVANKEHVLKTAYDMLSFGQQKLLSNMACFRSSISYQALMFITNKPSWKRKNKSRLNEKLDDSLQILESYGLLNWNRQVNKYYLHPIVRRYSYESIAVPDRIIAHRRLRDYFATITMPAKPLTLDDLAPTIELYHHNVLAGEYDTAFHLLRDRLRFPLHFQFGAFHTYIALLRALFPDNEEKPKLKERGDQGWVFNALAGAYAFSGETRLSLLLAKQSISDEKSIKKDNLSIGLSNIGSNLQLPLGAFRNAESNLVRAFELAKETKNEFHEAVCQEALSHLLFYIGKWDEAEQKSLIALEFFEKMKETQGQSSTLAYYALQFLQKNRDNAQASIQNGKLAIQFASRALELAEEIARTASPISRDLIRTHWLLGASYLLNNQFNLAEQHLSEALTRDRISNMVDHEANILLELARLRYSQKNYEESKTHAEEALSITERCGYVLQGADVNLFLAQYALEQEKDKAKAKQYAEEAKQLATCDGPPYYYKVAYEEAEAMLKKLG